jgi:hypothetical protein
MAPSSAIWIKDPLGILPKERGCGIVVRDGKIVELIPAGREPATARPDQHPSSFLPDAHAGAAGCDGPRAVSMAARALSRLGADDAGDACRKSNAYIQMMESAKKWRGQNVTNGMYCSRQRRVLVD